MSEYTTHKKLDVRELDCILLGSVAGAHYYELRQILRVNGQQRLIVGRASDWPIVKACAERDESIALATAAQHAQAEADAHCVQLIADKEQLTHENEQLRRHITALEHALGEQAFSERIAEPHTNGHLAVA